MIRVERAFSAVILTIDRPPTKNAINRSTAAELAAAVESAAADPEVRGIVITGQGNESFVSGGDLRELVALAARENGLDEVLAMGEKMSVIESCDVPVIAAVQGDAYGGGCELLLLCDMVIIEEHAGLAFRHAKMGLSPAWGGLTRLIERVGPIEAARVLFTAERIAAVEALRMGFVNQVTPKGAARAAAIARVNTIAANPRVSVASMKRALREVREAKRGAAAAAERKAIAELWGGVEHLGAMDAFFTRKIE